MHTGAYRILIVDDHPIVRDGLIRLIKVEGGMEICGETGDGHAVLGLIGDKNPDAVILDLSLESGDGMELIGRIRARYPALAVLVLTMHDESKLALRCLRAGARGFLMKKCASREILDALSEMRKGGIYASDSVKHQLLTKFSHGGKAAGEEVLSKREFIIYCLYGQGLQTSEIAAKLSCSCKTIETHCLRIRRKLNLRSINELIACAGAFLCRNDPVRPCGT